MKARKRQAALKAINQILWRDWDPIGFNTPEDEYQTYCPGVLRLLEDGADRHKLTEHLMRVADQAMSCPITVEKAALVADKLMELNLER